MSGKVTFDSPLQHERDEAELEENQRTFTQIYLYLAEDVTAGTNILIDIEYEVEHDIGEDLEIGLAEGETEDLEDSLHHFRREYPAKEFSQTGM